LLLFTWREWAAITAAERDSALLSGALPLVHALHRWEHRAARCRAAAPLKRDLANRPYVAARRRLWQEWKAVLVRKRCVREDQARASLRMDRERRRRGLKALRDAAGRMLDVFSAYDHWTARAMAAAVFRWRKVCIGGPTHSQEMAVAVASAIRLALKRAWDAVCDAAVGDRTCAFAADAIAERRVLAAICRWRNRHAEMMDVVTMGAMGTGAWRVRVLRLMLTEWATAVETTGAQRARVAEIQSRKWRGQQQAALRRFSAAGKARVSAEEIDQVVASAVRRFQLRRGSRRLRGAAQRRTTQLFLCSIGEVEHGAFSQQRPGSWEGEAVVGDGRAWAGTGTGTDACSVPLSARPHTADVSFTAAATPPVKASRSVLTNGRMPPPLTGSRDNAGFASPFIRVPPTMTTTRMGYTANEMIPAAFRESIGPTRTAPPHAVSRSGAMLPTAWGPTIPCQTPGTAGPSSRPRRSERRGASSTGVSPSPAWLRQVWQRAV
jgi:hypothetical protein